MSLCTVLMHDILKNSKDFQFVQQCGYNLHVKISVMKILYNVKGKQLSKGLLTKTKQIERTY